MSSHFFFKRATFEFVLQNKFSSLGLNLSLFNTSARSEWAAVFSWGNLVCKDRLPEQQSIHCVLYSGLGPRLLLLLLMLSICSALPVSGRGGGEGASAPSAALIFTIPSHL